MPEWLLIPFWGKRNLLHRFTGTNEHMICQKIKAAEEHNVSFTTLITHWYLCQCRISLPEPSKLSLIALSFDGSTDSSNNNLMDTCRYLSRIYKEALLLSAVKASQVISLNDRASFPFWLPLIYLKKTFTQICLMQFLNISIPRLE